MSEAITPPPELQQRLEAYLRLIEQLVSCPAGEEPSVLQAHQDLLDLPFLQVLGAVAEQAYQQEETRPIGKFLGQLGIHLQGAFVQALQERLAAYQQLVRALAACEEGETEQVLAAHPDLQDAGLVLYLGQEAGKLQVLGQGAIAARLLRLGQELGARLGLSSRPEPEAPARSLLERLRAWVEKKAPKKETVPPPQEPRKPEVPYLVLRLLQLSQARQEQAIYQLLRQSALPESLGEDLARWAEGVVPHLPPEQRQGVVGDIGRLGEYLLRAPVGNIAVQMEVAIRVLEVALSYWDKEADPQGWAARHHQLAIAYSDCPRGDKQRNYQQALVHYQQALQVYRRMEHPLDWGMVQNNMGLLYRQWPGEQERSVHMELAIACFQSALESYTPEAQPQLWAITQVNLGQSYAERQQGDRLENLHKAISCYLQALPVLEAQQMVGAKQQAQQLLMLAEQALFQEQQKTVVQVAGETVQIGDQVLAAPQLVQRLHRYELWPELRVQMLIDTLVREIPWSEAEQAEGLAAWQQQVGQQGAEWLAQRGLTEAELPGWVTRTARLRRLQEQMFGHKVETYFLERKGSLDRVRYYLIRHEDEGVLRELAFRIANREGDVEALASEYGQGEEAQIGGLIGPVELGQLPPALAALLQTAPVGQVIGPVHLGQQFGLLMVKQKIGARLTAEIRKRLLEELFMRWVREQLGYGMG